MRYELVECAGSYFIIDSEHKADNGTLTDSLGAYISGSQTREEKMEGGWKRRIVEPKEGARELAEKIVGLLNAEACAHQVCAAE